jgi:hypothetical protein
MNWALHLVRLSILFINNASDTLEKKVFAVSPLVQFTMDRDQRLLGSEGKVDSLFVLSGHVCAYATPLAEVVGLLFVVEFPVTNNPVFYPEIQPPPCVGDGDGKC